MYTPNCTPNRPFPLKPLVAAVLLVCASGIHSAPILHHSTGKEVTVAPPVDLSVGKVTTVTQHVDRTVVDWKEFSIAEGELVKFMQPDANSVILNRVVGGDLSQILGELQANGRVFLINPNGIVFGAKSQVNVGSLVASTLNVDDKFKFKNDKQEIEQLIEFKAETSSGKIESLGSIHAKDIVFLAPVIKQNGSLNASAAVNLIAASEVTANLGGADMVFTVKAGHENALIDQLGSVLAAGGKIVLLATASINGSGSVINTAGINQASQISIQGDTVQLTGTFNASNPENALQVNAKRIYQNAALTVAGSSQLIADEVTLYNAGNDFTGQLKLNVKGAAELQDLNSLNVSGKADRLVLTAEEITQTGTLEVGKTTTLTANTVTLNNAGNDFKGQVNVAASVDAHLRDINNLAVTGDVNNATLEGDKLLINGLRAAGDLTLKANAVDQNPDLANALTVQGKTRIEARVKNTGTVNLNNKDNDFVRKVDLVDVGTTTLFDKNSLFIEGHAGVLTLTANSVDQEQGGRLAVDNTTRINAASVLLNNPENDFKGLVDLNVSGLATLHDANTLRVAGKANEAVLNAGRIEIANILKVTENLTLTASEIKQDAALTVDGDTSIDGTASAMLENAGNDFVGAVNLKNKANAALRDKNKITVAGSAGSLTVNAPLVTPGEVTLGDLTANSLTVNAAAVNQVNSAQAEKVIVENASTFNAGKVELLNDGNDFKGQVNFAVTDQVKLHDANNLIVAGKVRSAEIDAQTLALNGLSAAGNLVLKANDISDGQNGAVVVTGTSTLQGGTANLDNSGNRFEGVVNLDLSGAARVHSSEDLEVAGKAASVSASAGQTLTVSSLTSEMIVLDGKQVQLNGFSTAGNLTLKGGDVKQRGALAVDGVTTLSAAKVTLDDAGNDFKKTVVLNAAGDVKIHDANSISLEGTANKLTAKAIADVNQTAALTVTKTSDITAANIHLNDKKNVFGEVVTVNAAQLATVHSDQNLEVGGNANTLNAVAGENLRLSSATVGTLNAAGNNIRHAASTDNVQVNGKATLTAQNVDLQNASNDFKGTLDLAVTGQADIVDGNDLFMTGRSQVLNATVGGTLTAGELEMGSGTLTASTIQMNKLNVLDKARLQATTVTQTEANQSGGEITIAADTVNLALENDFKGQVVLDNVGMATIHDSNQLALSGSTKTLNLRAKKIEQSDALKVQGRTDLDAESVELINANNDFEGVVALQVTGKSLLRDTNSVAVQGNVGELIVQAANTVTLGSVQAGSLSVTSNVLEQSAAVDVLRGVVLNTKTANLIEEGNAFRGSVVLNGGNNTLHAAGDLKVEGNSAQLNVKAKNVEQSNTLTVTGLATLTADTVTLADEKNDFQSAVNVKAKDSVAIQDKNDLSISGSMQQLDVTAGKALELKNLTAEIVNAQADQIKLDNLASSKSTHLNAGSVTQGESLSLNGETTVQATSVKLENKNNDFGGVLNLNTTEFAEIVDANTLTLGDVRGGGVLKLTAQSVAQDEVINSGASINHSGAVEVNAATVQLNRISNDFSGHLTVNSDNATVVDSNALNINFVGRNLSATAKNLVMESIQASGNVVLSAETADVSSKHDLSIQGNVGDLTVRANRLTQAQALTVRNRADLQAAAVELLNDANDFQGEVVLNVSGSTKLNDENTLVVSGNANGPAQIKAQSIQQTKALNAKSSLTLQANQIVLDNNANTLNGVVRIEGEGLASQATLHSQGELAVEGANIADLTLVSKEAVLGDLGKLQQLAVTAEKTTQGAALHVQQKTLLNADNVNLSNSKNDFVGEVTLAGKDSSLPVVSIADQNSLNIQATDVKLAAQVQGDLGLKAQNVVLNATTVEGGSNINLTGALTQNELVNLSNAVLKADSIALKDMGNRFNGTTQLDSSKTIQMSTSGDLNADKGTSTGALSLSVGGNSTVKGTQVVFAQSRFDGNLEVNANGISQTDSLQVGGAAKLNAVGGTISLQHANNQFQTTVSATAEKTDIAARGDLQVMNLMSRGGQITADGRLLLVGNVEQTGGTLTFTAKGAPRPLSSADIAMLLPPALDVFSAKDAVDPITGLGRITLASTSIHQKSGQILTAAGSMTQFNSTANGSVVLTKNNQINGQFAALSGKKYGQAYGYNPEQGASLFAVNNDVQLRVAGMGIEADVVAIRARGLSTTGDVSQIRARIPYNDIAAGTSRSFAGLTLSIPIGNASGSQGGVAPFGESSGVGQAAAVGAIRVEVGEVNRAGFGGFVTVLPFEGNNLLPGQVVYLAGPERKGTYAFFYDGARSLNRVPVVYNGSLLVSPQESAALTTAQGAVVLARQEQTRSVVRTENVAGKIINGVVLEVGPGRPATEGTGGAGKPASCDAAEEGLSCNP